MREAFQKTNDKIAELERNHHRLVQYSRRECLDFSGIPNAVPPKESEIFVIHALEEIGINLNKSQIVAWHRQRLGKTGKNYGQIFKQKRC